MRSQSIFYLKLCGAVLNNLMRMEMPRAGCLKHGSLLNVIQCTLHKMFQITESSREKDPSLILDIMDLTPVDRIHGMLLYSRIEWNTIDSAIITNLLCIFDKAKRNHSWQSISNYRSLFWLLKVKVKSNGLLRFTVLCTSIIFTS